MTEGMSHEDRFIDLESKLAFQERTLAVLNEVVTEQQNSIDRLTARLESVVARFGHVLATSGDDDAESSR